MFLTVKILRAQEAEKAEAEDREEMDAEGAGKDSSVPPGTDSKKINLFNTETYRNVRGKLHVLL